MIELPHPVASPALRDVLGKYIRSSEKKPVDPWCLLNVVMVEAKLALWEGANWWHAEILGVQLAGSANEVSFAGLNSPEWLDHRWRQAFLEEPPERSLPLEAVAAYGFAWAIEAECLTNPRAFTAFNILHAELKKKYPIPGAGILE